MKKLFTLISLFLILINPVSARELISAKTDSLIQTGIRLSIEQSFGEAFSIFSTMKNEMPENPAGYFFCAAVLQFQMMDAEIYDHEDDFFSLIAKTIELSQLHLKKNHRDARAYFFLGSAYGYLSFYQAKQNDYVKSFQNGMRSVRVLENALRADSTLYDAYLGLGTYKYYRSKLSRHFTWLPFVKDERSEGIALVRLAINKGNYARLSAMNNFCWIAIKEEDYQAGWQMVQSALNEFPDSRVFLWCAAKLATKLGRWQNAIDSYNNILSSLKNQKVHSPYNEFVCRKNLHLIYMEQNNYEKAEAECEKMQKIRLDKKTEKRLARLLKEVQRSCRQLSDTILIGERGE